MYDIESLEHQWEQYKRSRRRPYILLGSLVLLIGIGSAVLYYTHGPDLFLDKENSSTAKNDKQAIVYVENTSLERLETREKIEKEAEEESSSEIVENLPLSSDRPVRKKPRVKIDIITTEMPTVKKSRKEEEKPHERVYLSIKKRSDSSAYKAVAARFRETKDPDDSLFLARAYYNAGRYKKAEYWALQTNNVNSSIEESILIFAKAKAKRGHRNEAIRVLKKYIKGSDSQEARRLLSKIKKRKL